MRRSLGFQQQQCYANETEEESFAAHEETWSSQNNHHNHFQGMHMKNGGALESHDFSRRHHGSFGGGRGNFEESYHGHRDYASGGNRLHLGGHRHGHGHGNFSEESEFESHKEMHNGGGKMKVDEMRYERHNWGAGAGAADAFCANPHGHGNTMNSFRKVQWGVKGV